MSFMMFILVNAMVFIRPGEVVPALAGVQVYLFSILACSFIALPALLQVFMGRTPGLPPITACVLGLMPAILLSHLSHGEAGNALDGAVEYTKVLLYFLLLLALVLSTSRLRQFLFWTGVFSALVAFLAVTNYHGAISLAPPPSVESPRTKGKGNTPMVEERVRDAETGRMAIVQRMCGTGIFNDPNDLGVLLVGGIFLSLYWMTDRQLGFFRYLWIPALLLFGYALTLTHSRGSFLALLAGLFAFIQARWGWKRGMMLGALCLPVLLVVFAGRMTQIDSSGTGQSRIQLWAQGIILFREAPLFGIGWDEFRHRSSHVAHNSFIHCFAELGIVGGTLFISAFFLAVWSVYRLGKEKEWVQDPDLRRLHPYLLALLVSYGMALLFLSRAYVVPTYMMLGLALVFVRLSAVGQPLPILNRLRLPMHRLAFVSMGFLATAYVFVQVFVRW